ncbi:type I restriction-modification system subunit M [Vibrio diazotrophicus]|jgi:type I restriction enzyme M protein|uniref:site-specific DNA-methyltransferase (adenine-specific) n=1 Tax=Vibrio diazotrophicus TaxID=685 RepID=A0ABX4W989_VIBDI|nr:type I restriction-modification system subunit M [Vibrio diazotrophicus]PNI00023.1 DNA methyltransferase [Vibrio diazotrophicus]
MSLQQKIDRITDILRRDDGISGAMHYTEQTSWVLFLKFLDDYESEKEDEAVLSGKDYQPVLDEDHRWSNWACPKNADGKLDINQVLTGDDLTDYVNNELFPYLKSFANSAITGSGVDPKSFAYKIGAIFQYLDNKVASGHTLREVLDIIDTLNFQSSDEMFELSLVYEGLLQNMGDAGGYAGEFYTPRPVVRAMIKAIDPQAGQTIYDAAAGSCGFLVEAFDHLKAKKGALSTEQWDFIQRDTFFGFEKTSLAYVMGMMNMILHGIESPNLFRGNTLTQNIRDIQEKDRYDIILANPPFGGKEKDQIQQNFPIKANATELLFMQHFMKTLKSGGKAAIVVPEGVLFQTNSAFKQVKQELLENFNLHTILSLPAGVFLPYSGVKTNVLFFERSGGTSDVWYYECEPEQKLTKNKPITDDHLKEFVELYNNRETTERSWTVSASKLAEDYDLSAKNPSKQKDAEHLAPSDILKQIRTKEKLVSGLLDEIEDLLVEK